MKIKSGILKFNLCILCCTLFVFVAHSQSFDFSKASVIVTSEVKSPVRETILEILRDEVEKRTGIQLNVTGKWDKKTPVIALALASQPELFGIQVPEIKDSNRPELHSEGFRIIHNDTQGKSILWLIGNDERGLIYAAGWFLRNTRFTPKRIVLGKNIETASAPVYSIRG